MNFTGPLCSNGYRFPTIVNIKENSLLSSLSFFSTVSTLQLVIDHRVVPIGTSHLGLLRVWTHHSSTSVLLSLVFGARNGIVAVPPPNLPGKALAQAVQSLLRKGAFELAPLSSLGYFCRWFSINKALGVVAANITSLASCARYIILKEVYLLFPMHPSSGYFLRFVELAEFSNSWLFAWVSPQLRRSSRGSWLRFGVFYTVLQ